MLSADGHSFLKECTSRVTAVFTVEVAALISLLPFHGVSSCSAAENSRASVRYINILLVRTKEKKAEW